MVRPRHITRYQHIAGLLVRHRHAGPHASDTLSEDELQEDADHLAHELEDLGPTFVKLAQLLSTRADLLPQPYLTALSRLQDKVAPFPFEDVERIITEELGV